MCSSDLSLGGIIDVTKPGAAVLPPVSELTKFSESVAVAVATEAVKEGLNTVHADNPAENVKANKWYPVYKTI